MAERLEDLQNRLKGLDEIGQVVGALRAIASGQSTEARAAADAVRLYAETLQAALTGALAGTPAPPHPAGPGQLLVVGAAQGFSGAYPVRIASAAREMLAAGQALLVVGRRSLAMLEEAGLSAEWSDDLPAHIAAVPDLASRITDALLEQQSRYPGPISVLAMDDRRDGAPAARRLFPPVLPQAPARAQPPLTTLAPAQLWIGLLAEALFAGVAEALMQGIAAEAQARVEAMARAQKNLETRHVEIERASQQARQEQMTTEMIEISANAPPGEALF
ncbi:F0F1 ATP synthase subunit gamma [Xylophilus sp.]|uniref:F0F1 ATP synthase subunit gamma n=1 Tax=Xylophilus sp. TaxID=2653893 RepID=UPI0013B78CE0|nr:F0F1 ATP synthase subunit gamma [Xylophilus sp.]KAF1045291.1 MAG: ATP synthase gamma chain [Xylophilus sp.]